MTGKKKIQTSQEDAVTGLELLIVIAVIIIIIGIALFFHGSHKTAPAGVYTGGHQGLLVSDVRTTGDLLHPVGTIVGFSAINSVQDGVAIRFNPQNPAALGAVEMTVALFIGDMGGVDMDKMTVGWTMNGQTETIKKTPPPTLICPNWTIAQKLNMLPGQSADRDDILEPNEQFVLLVCPSRGVMSSQQATLTLSPVGDALPLPLPITAPSLIQPIMAL
ncbi:MAG: hypothetical protein WC406_10745 [Methanoregula sp.]